MTKPLTVYRARIRQCLRNIDRDITAAERMGDTERAAALQRDRMQVLMLADETIREMQAVEEVTS